MSRRARSILGRARLVLGRSELFVGKRAIHPQGSLTKSQRILQNPPSFLQT